MKKEKKARKEEKKTRAIVNEVFGNEKTKAKKNELVNMLTKTVMVNKAVMKKDKLMLKTWQHEYYQELFVKFKELINRHNEIYQFKSDNLINKIETRRTQLKTLKAEIKKAEAEKELIVK